MQRSTHWWGDTSLLHVRALFSRPDVSSGGKVQRSYIYHMPEGTALGVHSPRMQIQLLAAEGAAEPNRKFLCEESMPGGSRDASPGNIGIADPATASPRSPLVKEGSRAEPHSPSCGKRPREATFPVVKMPGLALERPQRQRRGTTRYDPDDTAALPQLMGTGKPNPVIARRASSSRAEDHGSPVTKRHLNTPMPPSPRVAAASAVLMGVHAPAEAWPPAWSPTRSSPRLVGRSMNDSGSSVPACDALLLLGVGSGGAGGSRPPREWSLGQPRTPLSPRSVASRQSGGAFAGLAYRAQLEAGLFDGHGTPASSSADGLYHERSGETGVESAVLVVAPPALWGRMGLGSGLGDALGWGARVTRALSRGCCAAVSLGESHG